MKYNFNTVPGYCQIEEATEVYKLVETVDGSILEAGCFTGKLTVGLADRFPDRNILALDAFNVTYHNYGVYSLDLEK